MEIIQHVWDARFLKVNPGEPQLKPIFLQLCFDFMGHAGVSYAGIR